MKQIPIKILVGLMLITPMTSVKVSAQQSLLDENIQELVYLQPGISRAEVTETISLYAEEINKTKEEASKEILVELKEQIELSKKEQKEAKNDMQTFGASSGSYKLPAAKSKGDIFYTPSSTLGINHGHNGIYYTKTTIVESIPNSGVRKIGYKKRNVEKNAVVQQVKTTQTLRNQSANWANGRVGDSYSYNFATNRLTGKYGAKNCSKLIWSAYMEKANLDIDANGGSGVYPKDLRDSSFTKTYKTIK